VNFPPPPVSSPSQREEKDIGGGRRIQTLTKVIGRESIKKKVIFLVF